MELFYWVWISKLVVCQIPFFDHHTNNSGLHGGLCHFQPCFLYLRFKKNTNKCTLVSSNFMDKDSMGK